MLSGRHGDYPPTDISDIVEFARLTIRRYCLPAVPQDRDTAFIVPIVNDALEDVSVSTPWHRAEEIPRDHLASLKEAASLKLRGGFGAAARRIEDDTAQLRGSVQNGGNERAIAPADIDDGRERREIIVRDHTERAHII